MIVLTGANLSFGAGSSDSAPTAPSAPSPVSSPNPATEDVKIVGPHLVIAKPTADAGEVERGKLATAVFELRNTGNQVLKILDARPGCGCTVASFDNTIEPGQTGKVTAHVKTESFRGPIEKTISVTSNDVTNPMVTLHVKANVVGSVEILPMAYLALPRSPTMDYTGKLLIRKDRTESGKLKLTDVTSTAPWLTTKTREIKTSEPESPGFPIAAQPGDWIIDVSVADDAPLQDGGQQIRFQTGLPREPQVSIPLSISFSQAMQVDRMNMVMIVPAGSTQANGSFHVALRPDLGKEVVTAKAVPDLFSVSLEPEGGRRYKANVTWHGGEDPAGRHGNVVLTAGKESVTVTVGVMEKPEAPPQAANPPGPPSAP